MKRVFITASACLATALAGCSTTSAVPEPSMSSSQTTASDSETSSSAQVSLAPSAQVKEALNQDPIGRTAWQRTLISHWCLTNAGVEAEINPNEPDALSANVQGEGAGEKFFREDQRCNAEYQLQLYKEPTRADAAKEFAHRKKTASCMQSKGVVVSEPPSEASFIDDHLKSIKTGEDLQVWSPWDQYLENDNLDQAEYNQMLEDCPRIAPE